MKMRVMRITMKGASLARPSQARATLSVRLNEGKGDNAAAVMYVMM